MLMSKHMLIFNAAKKIYCPFTLSSTRFASHCEYISKAFRCVTAKFVRDTTSLKLVNDFLVLLRDSRQLSRDPDPDTHILHLQIGCSAHPDKRQSNKKRFAGSLLRY